MGYTGYPLWDIRDIPDAGSRLGVEATWLRGPATTDIERYRFRGGPNSGLTRCSRRYCLRETKG